jgi:diguanylate cyclase (GGDEF)-like protein
MLHSFNVHSANLRRSASALLIALGLLCALCIFFVVEVADLRRTLRELRDNDLVRIEARNILDDLLDAEAGQRGFLLTGDPKFLEQYQHGRTHVGERIRRSREDGAMDEHLKGDAAQIMLLADAGLEELARTVALKRQGHDAAAIEVVKGGYGKSGLGKARRLIQTNVEQLRLVRDRLLEDLNRRIQRSAALLVLILGTVVALALHAWRSLSASVRVNSELAAHLAQEATHDALTGLPNRRFFDSWARQLVAKSHRDQSSFTLLMIDLDGFKKVNDTLGHAAGDEVLKAAATRFHATLRAGELLVRLGGDEFALLVEGNVSRIELIGLGERLMSSLRLRLHADLQDDAVGASIGVACFPQNGSDIDMLVEAADEALYQSKEGGRGMVSFAPTSRCRV